VPAQSRPEDSVAAIRDALSCGQAGCDCRSADGNVHCPGHDDSDPSLSINVKDGKVLVRCFANCTQAAVIDALRRKGLWPAKSAPRPPAKRIAATYPYTDAEGELLYEVVRYAPKNFRIRRPDGNGDWIWNLGGVEPLPYNLPAVVAAIAAGETVYIVEGEKDAEAIKQAGGVATTNHGGSGKWTPAHARRLAGANAIVVQDKDDAGRKHARQVAASLKGIAASVRLAEAAEGKDAAEHLAAGYSLGALVEVGDPREQNLAALLDGVLAFICRYVVLSAAQAVTIALFVAHTYVIGAVECTLYIIVTSAEKRSGKTRLLEVLTLVVAGPWFTGRVTAAVLARVLNKAIQTLLLDESDAAFKGSQDYAETLRGVLNAGYRRGATNDVCLAPKWEPAKLSSFGPKVIAGIGKLPDTIADRGVRVELKRKTRSESVARFRIRTARPEGEAIAARLAEWAETAEPLLAQASPALPEELDDRAQDGWEPLLAIAEMAGGDWPERAWRAAIELMTGDSREDDSPGVRLLAGIQRAFGDIESISTPDLLEALHRDEDGNWEQLTPRGLAQRLKRFGVRPDKWREGEQTVRGYHRKDLLDPWQRWLSPYSEQAPQAPQAPQTPDSDSASVADVAVVADSGGMGATRLDAVPPGPPTAAHGHMARQALEVAVQHRLLTVDQAAAEAERLGFEADDGGCW
jgi:5S rRNA maturation endonuclease (ribonuclease M5)